MKLESLHDLFVDELRDLYNAEHQLTEGVAEIGQGCRVTRLANGI